MRKIERDRNYITFIDGFDKQLEVLSPYCFISDFPASERDHYFFKGVRRYENTYLIHKELKDALEEQRFSEEDILFFHSGINLNEYFFYIETEFSIVTIESLTVKGRYSMDFINLALKNQFSDAVNKTLRSAKDKLKALVEEKDKLVASTLTEQEFIDFFKTSFKVFLKDVTSSPFIIVQSTFILFSENYKEVKDFVLGNLNLTSSDRIKRIKTDIEELESILKSNMVLPGKRYFQSIVEADINNYEYISAKKKLEDSGGPQEIVAILSYAQLLFNNPDQFDWNMKIALLESIDLRATLLNGFDRFEHLEDEKVFMEVKRKLSKAEIFLNKGDYSNFVGALQKFMEAYLEAIGANKKINTKNEEVKLTRISDKMKQALYLCQNNNQGLLNPQILESFAICFDENKTDAIIKRINPDYIPLNHPRNGFQHADIGLSYEGFTKKLGYIVEEELGEEENTGHFKKYLEWFQMPEKNVFNQINQRVMELLSKPDLIFSNETTIYP